MRYRNIQINYGELRQIHTKLGIYKQAVWQLMDSMKKIHKIIIDSSNLTSVLSLNDLYIVTQNQLQSCHDEIEALHDLLGNYIKEMTALVGAGEGVTQVNRNDVYWNLQFMYGILDQIKNVRHNNPLPIEDGLGKTDAQIQAMKNNYKKADNDIVCIALPSLYTCIKDCKKTLRSYYEDKIVEYENTDDAYRKKAKKIRKEYSDENDRDLQSAKDFGNVVTDLFAGAYFTVTELLSTVLVLADFMVFDGGELLALITMLMSPESPKWAKELTANETAPYDLLKALLSDPVEVLESLAQQANDEYDKNGLIFYIGSILADIAITKGTSKVAKAMKAGSATEDVVKFSDDVPKYQDDLASSVSADTSNDIDIIKADGDSSSEKLAGSNKNHINGSIGEIHGYQDALNNGEIGIQPPGKVTASGPDYITYDPATGQINVWDAKYSSKGKWPKTAKGFGSEKWLEEVKEAIEKIADPKLRKEVMDAFNNGEINWKIFKWPQ